MIHKSVQTCESVLMRKIEQIWIGAADRERLERLVRDRNTPQKVVWRAQIVLSASEGMTAEAIASTVAKSLLTVRRWRQRYTAEGVEGLLKDATRPSRVKTAVARVDQARGALDSAREAAQRDPLERPQHGGSRRHLLE